MAVYSGKNLFIRQYNCLLQLLFLNSLLQIQKPSEKNMDREEIIDKHKYLLDKMKEDRIFSICFENNAVYLNEQCDDYFSHQLTKEECLELSRLFGELATIMNRR